MNSPRFLAPAARPQAGFSLIEVLVAILVVALGILTMIAMQINSTKLTKTSEIRAMSSLLVSDLADRMRANRVGLLAGRYSTTESADAPAVYNECAKDTANCSPEDMARQDLSDWLNNIRQSLPAGTARVSGVDQSNGKSGVDVWLIWADPDEPANGGTPSPSSCPADMKIATDKTVVRCMYFRINV
jgi:type IV pilus assembly protein PilV